MAASFPDIVRDGPILVAVLVSALAGLASFLSPCVIPLVPGYLSFVAGLAGAEVYVAANGPNASSDTSANRLRLGSRVRMLAGAGLFVTGFTVVFLLLGVLFGQIGRQLVQYQRATEFVVGVCAVFLGIAFSGVLPGVQSERRIRHLPRAGLIGAPILGFTFALGWVPCLTPTLGVVLGLAAVGGSEDRGILMAIAYSAGLGLPFLAFAVFARWAIAAVAVTRPIRRIVSLVGGILLIAVGIALMSGTWTDFIVWLRSVVPSGLNV